ncbi:unnamed protein product [Acanthosepion pharaonis]|uniref:Uncharacterized protein n=1 Tax=Acanthosepion pharaonis TaxID=158019 RepID=A0A812ARR0_ACAPH|nr:unnamed protein product [Sepia pharaonis]
MNGPAIASTSQPSIELSAHFPSTCCLSSRSCGLIGLINHTLSEIGSLSIFDFLPISLNGFLFYTYTHNSSVPIIPLFSLLDHIFLSAPTSPSLCPYLSTFIGSYLSFSLSPLLLSHRSVTFYLTFSVSYLSLSLSLSFYIFQQLVQTYLSLSVLRFSLFVHNFIFLSSPKRIYFYPFLSQSIHFYPPFLFVSNTFSSLLLSLSLSLYFKAITGPGFFYLFCLLKQIFLPFDQPIHFFFLFLRPYISIFPFFISQTIFSHNDWFTLFYLSRCQIVFCYPSLQSIHILSLCWSIHLDLCERLSFFHINPIYLYSFLSQSISILYIYNAFSLSPYQSPIFILLSHSAHVNPIYLYSFLTQSISIAYLYCFLTQSMSIPYIYIAFSLSPYQPPIFILLSLSYFLP